VRVIASRLAEFGMPVDLRGVIAAVSEQRGHSIGRPQVARAMIASGYVSSTQEAFDRWLGRDRPAFVPRTGPSPEAVIETIHRSGGLASLAHPGRTMIDARIPALADAGLDALEAIHSDHDSHAAERYCRMADDLGLLVTGGSDYHGDPAKVVSIGIASLPPAAWQRLRSARHRHAVP
jgi:predicted metal-dependent phosphoesterase TrpH